MLGTLSLTLLFSFAVAATPVQDTLEYKRGMMFLNRTEYGAALAEFQRLKDLRPDDTLVVVQLARGIGFEQEIVGQEVFHVVSLLRVTE